MGDGGKSVQSKNWPEVKWRKVEQPSIKPKIRLPKIEWVLIKIISQFGRMCFSNSWLPPSRDLPISKECSLSKPLRIPHVQRAEGQEADGGYSDLSCLLRYVVHALLSLSLSLSLSLYFAPYYSRIPLRMDIFPGQHVTAISAYTSTFSNPFLDPMARRANTTSHRRRCLGFTKRLEHDLSVKRIQAAWNEYYEGREPVINWEERLKRSAKIRTSPTRKPKVVEQVSWVISYQISLYWLFPTLLGSEVFKVKVVLFFLNWIHPGR